MIFEELGKHNHAVIVNDWLPPDVMGGAEKSMIVFSEKLKKFVSRVEFVSILNYGVQKSDPSYHLVPTLRIRSRSRNSIPFKFIDFLVSQIDLLTPILVAVKIRRMKPDVVILHNINRFGLIFPFLIKVLLPKEVYLVRYFHDLSDICWFRERYFKGEICQQTCAHCKPKEFISSLWSRYYGSTIHVSRFVFNQLTNSGMIYRNSYLIYPIEFQKGNKVKKSYNAQTRRVAFLGSIRRSKGIEDLMNASAMCDPKWDVVAIGTVSKRYMERLKRLALLLEINFEIIEFSNRPYDLLEGRASLIAVPSKWPEPFGRIPFESVSNGFPVVLSNSGGLAEVNQFFSTPQPTFYSGNIEDLHETLQSLNQDELSILHETEVRLAPIVKL